MVTSHLKLCASGLVTGCTTTFFSRPLLATCKVKVYNHQNFLKQVYRDLGPSSGLITVCNHTSTLDDPVLWGAVMPFWQAWNPRRVRWSIGARELTFTNPVFSTFFDLGKVIPIDRGRGLDQEGVKTAIQKLDEGEWVHVFPEGKVNQVGKLLPVRWGVGKLVADAQVAPTVLPFYHTGMHELMPGGPGLVNTYVPRPFGKTIRILFGEPLDMKTLLEEQKEKGSMKKAIYKAVTDRIEEELRKLEAQIHRIKVKEDKS